MWSTHRVFSHKSPQNSIDVGMDPASHAPSRVKGVTFDLDDTLWCGVTVIRRASAAFHAFVADRAPSVASNFPPSDFNALLGQFQKELPHKAHDYTFLRKQALRHCLNHSAADADVAALVADELALETFVEEAFQAFLIPRSEPDFFDGVDTLFDQIRAELTDAATAVSKMPVIGVITNGNCVMQRLPLFFQDHVDFMISAEGVGVAKPASAIFDAAVARFEPWIKREEIVHVGDHYEADVAGAKRAGMRTIWVDAKRSKPDVFHRRDMDSEDAAQHPEADAIVRHVGAVIHVIQQWNREVPR